jgi:hypothetical protein
VTLKADSIGLVVAKVRRKTADTPKRTTISVSSNPSRRLAAASGWPARARRVRPHAPCKDWTEAFQYPINLRRWCTDRLRGIEAPALSAWDELASMRWGSAIYDATPGIMIG